LKKEYSEHVKTLGATGAGLASDQVWGGSDISNLVGTFGIFFVHPKSYLILIYLLIR
jgi:hypothetical protein